MHVTHEGVGSVTASDKSAPMRLSKLALSTASLPLHEQGILVGSDAHSDHSSRADNSQGVEEQILRSRR